MSGGEGEEWFAIHELWEKALAALRDPVNLEAEGRAAAMVAIRDGARGLAKALRRARLAYGDLDLDDPRLAELGFAWNPEIEGPQLSPSNSRKAVFSAVMFLDLIGDLFAALDDPDRSGELGFVARLTAVKGWRRPKNYSQGWMRRRLAARCVHQLMAFEAATTGKRPSQKKAIAIVREQTGLPVSKIKLGLREYRLSMQKVPPKPEK